MGSDLGGTSIKAALINRESGIVELRSSPTLAQEGPESVINRIAQLIGELIREAPGGVIGGIGIGAPGAVNWDRDTVINPPNLYGWKRVNLQQELQGRLRTNLPVIVENDS